MTDDLTDDTESEPDVRTDPVPLQPGDPVGEDDPTVNDEAPEE
jgi:hypothetical protein